MNDPARQSDVARRLAGLSAEKRALLEQRLRSPTRSIAADGREPLAIIGMACRFPGGSDDPRAFWELLRSGKDAVHIVPDHRRAWYHSLATARESDSKILQQAGFLEHVDQFDAAFFNISPREAQQMDPQQRLLLMTVWEALETAGQSQSSLAGTDSGVFIGIHSQSSDYYWKQIADVSTVDTYTATGGAHSIVANRLSYFLDLRGPSMVVDTACSSSLVALHLACQSLRNQECDLGIVGGVNLLLSPETSYAFSKLQFLSPQGRCRTFDAAADGFVRGEGCGVIVLRRYTDAVKRREPVLALICGSAVNQDGATNGLTAPSGLSQQAVVRKALNGAGVDPDSIGFVETHGTGTKLGDPIEVEALASVLQKRAGGHTCYLGAVKSNIGHLEAAAGIAGVIKTVLCLIHRLIPANLHFAALNPNINLSQTRFIIPQESVEWESSTHPRTAGVSSFGFGGTNAHVILREAPETVQELRHQDRSPRLFFLSAKCGAALKELAQKYAAYLRSQPHIALTDLCFTLHSGRTHFEHRLAVVAESLLQLSAELQAFVDDQAGAYMATSPTANHGGLDSHREDVDLGNLRRMGVSYIRGEAIDVQDLYGTEEGKIIPLPSYAWQLRRYWVDDKSEKDAPERLSSPDVEPATPHRNGKYYRVAWRRQDELRSSEASALADDWIIYNDRLGVGDHLVDLLEERGGRCYVVQEGSGFKDLGKDRFEIAAACDADVERLTKSIAHLTGTGRVGVVYLWGLRAEDYETKEAEHLHQEVIRSCGSALSLQKFICDPAIFEDARVWLVTRGAQPVLATQEVDPGQAPIWGFGRVVALESPHSLSGMVDLDPDSVPERCAQQLFEAIVNHVEEEQIAYRGAHRYVARLINAPLARIKPEPFRFDSKGSYMITGGLGRIGLMLARWMAAHGAGCLVLLSRRSLDEAFEDEAIRSAKAAGATVCVVSGDVADKQQMDALFRRFDADLPPLRGIMHAAGVISPEPLAGLTAAKLSSACESKVRGTWILHELTRNRDLAFFILFSSAAAILGAREMAHYAAANHFLDAFAHYASLKGQRVCSINWGRWTGGWQDDHLTRHFSQAGLKAISDIAGMAALEDCLSSPTVQTLFADIDWQRLVPIYTAQKRGLS